MLIRSSKQTHNVSAQAQQTWALDGGKIYSAPDVAPIKGKVVIAGNKILSVATGEPRATVELCGRLVASVTEFPRQ